MNATPQLERLAPPLRLPRVQGVIERRILANFRCAPDVLAKIVPAPFRPKLVNGWGIAGICLIRLGEIRPVFLPAFAGIRSENAAHRIAVIWDENGVTREGVFIPRRDTDSLLNRIAGGRVFPGLHHAAQFRVWETGDRYKLEMHSIDRSTFVRVLARTGDCLPATSVFKSISEASAFFQAGGLGWSTRAHAGEFDGLELACDQCNLQPLAVERIESSFFDNRDLFPVGTARFDSAFLMRNLDHKWIARGKLKLA